MLGRGPTLTQSPSARAFQISRRASRTLSKTLEQSVKESRHANSERPRPGSRRRNARSRLRQSFAPAKSLLARIVGSVAITCAEHL